MGYLSPKSVNFTMSRIIAVLSRFCFRNNRLVQLTKYCEKDKKKFLGRTLFSFLILSTLLAIHSFTRQVYLGHLLFFELVPIGDISVKT